MNFATCTADSQQLYRAVTDTGLIALCPVPETVQLDHDGEGAAIIGTGGRRIPEADADPYRRPDAVKRRHAARLGAPCQV